MAHAPTALSRAIAAEVGALMGRHHMNQKQLAAATGIEPSSLSRCLNGRRGWDVEPLAQIAHYFGKTLEELVASAEAAERDTLDESHHSGVVCFEPVLAGV